MVYCKLQYTLLCEMHFWKGGGAQDRVRGHHLPTKYKCFRPIQPVGGAYVPSNTEYSNFYKKWGGGGGGGHGPPAPPAPRDTRDLQYMQLRAITVPMKKSMHMYNAW